jgi:hypothetical protein
MAPNRKSLREALDRAERSDHETQRPVDKDAREKIATESSARYRNAVTNLNRIRDREIDRALQGR